jgi:hypothetical protein
MSLKKPITKYENEENEELLNEEEKERRKKLYICQEHPNENYRYYCLECL